MPFGLDFNFIGKSLFSGLLIQAAPALLKGAMKESLWKIKLGDFVGYVQKDTKLWDMISDKDKNSLLEFGPKMGPLDWLTLEWVMEAGREGAPVLYSALEGWPAGQEWLSRQIEDIKKHLGG